MESFLGGESGRFNGVSKAYVRRILARAWGDDPLPDFEDGTISQFQAATDDFSLARALELKKLRSLDQAARAGGSVPGPKRVRPVYHRQATLHVLCEPHRHETLAKWASAFAEWPIPPAAVQRAEEAKSDSAAGDPAPLPSAPEARPPFKVPLGEVLKDRRLLKTVRNRDDLFGENTSDLD